MTMAEAEEAVTRAMALVSVACNALTGAAVVIRPVYGVGPETSMLELQLDRLIGARACLESKLRSGRIGPAAGGRQ